MPTHKLSAAYRRSLPVLLLALVVFLGCGPGGVATGRVASGGVVFEYEAGTRRLSARIDESSGLDAIAIPNWNDRVAFLVHNGVSTRIIHVVGDPA